MKKSIFIITFCLSFSMFLGILLLGCTKTNTPQNQSVYQMELSFDGKNELSGKENVTFYNYTDNALSYLQFNLFANAFQDKDFVVTASEQDRAYYDGFSEGNIEIQYVSMGEKELSFSYMEESRQILKVDLPDELFPDEKVTITLEFKVTLASINHRLGVGKNTINLGNFYPILSVYENGKGFYQNTYQPYGDPFFSKVASYEVKFSCPSSFVVASSGVKQDETAKDGIKTSVFKGENMRDFALVLSNNFSSAKSMCGDVEVEYFGYSGDNDITINQRTAFDAIKYFSKKFGSYPYKKISVVKNSFVQGGMEYPSLVMISDENESESLSYVIVHEIAHQWWYAGVGNNQYENAWIDEGLSEYSTLMFFRDNIQYDRDYKELIASCNESYNIYKKVQSKVYGEVDEKMAKPLDKFSSSPEYVALCYTKSTLMFNSLEETLGEKKFEKALLSLYEKYKFQEVSREEFIALMSSSTHRNLEGFFNSWLDGSVVIV